MDYARPAGEHNWLMGGPSLSLHQDSLVHPHNFLKATLPFVEPLYTAVVGWTLVSWDFRADLVGRHGIRLSQPFSISSTGEGHPYSLTLSGEGRARTRPCLYGDQVRVRVLTMGVAFMVMMPVMYSDVTDLPPTSNVATPHRSRWGHC